MNKQLSIIGILLTVIYLIILYVLISNRIDSINTLSLNEVGDFLAGAFGPLAILWLILGFFQQGIELRQNTNALELQAKELKNSVIQQKELVEVSKQQFSAEIEALNYEREQYRKSKQPIFVTHGIGGHHSASQNTYTFNISNVGNTATDVHFSFNREMRRVQPDNLPSFIKGQNFRFKFEYMNWVPEEDTTLTINYIDSSGIPGSCEYILIANNTGSHPVVDIEKKES